MKRQRLVAKKIGVDRGLLSIIFTLLFLGLIAVADASAPQALNSFNDKFYFFKQQAAWAAGGVVLLFITSRIPVTFWEKIATPFFFSSALLLILVLFPAFSFKALGARRWIDLGLFSFQPAELIKLSLAIYFAKLAKNSKKASAYFLPLIVIVGLVMLQPDLGTTLIITAIALAQIFVSGVNLFFFLGSIVLGGLLALGLILMSPYRRDRLNTFLESTADPLGKGYHIRQILLALGSGGIFGVGIGASRQKYLFLPEAATDSIFAVIAEEMGLIGAIILMSLFVFFIYKGFKIALNSHDKFSQVLAVGLTSWIGGQAALNISSMVALTPLTGIPLPFFSYGGSSLVMILVACGILLNISRSASKNRKK